MRGLLKIIPILLLFGIFVYLMPERGFALADVDNVSYLPETFIPQNGTITTTAGYIYGYNLTTTEKTYRWVGLWGNISGSVQLRTATDTFYTWQVSTVTEGSVVYATTVNTGIDPTDFGFFNESFLNQADAACGYLTTVSDSITNTYTGVGDFDSPSRDTNVTTNRTAVGSWYDYVMRLDDTDFAIGSIDEIIWAGVVEPGQSAFNGELADYELMVPENEEAGDGEGTTTTYYLWVEIY